MIFAIKPFEIHDGNGIRTTVFFKGCPLRCKWCHNPESFSAVSEVMYDPALCRDCMRCTTLCSANTVINGKHVFRREACISCGKCRDICMYGAITPIGEDIPPKELVKVLLRDSLFMKGSGGGVTFSGGEPLMQADECAELARLLKEEGIDIAIDTSLAVSKEALDKVIPYTNTFLVDIKAIDRKTHILCTGKPNDDILDNIRYLDSKNIPMEIRYPYIPTLNDREAPAIADFLKTLHSVICVRVLAYHNMAEGKYANLGLCFPTAEIPIPREEEIEAVRMLLGAAPD